MEKCKITGEPIEGTCKDKVLNTYPGAAVDAADDDKVDRTLVKEETYMLNNNRNTQP